MQFQVHSGNPSAVNNPAARKIAGRRLDELLNSGRLTPAFTALLAVDMECGEIDVSHFTPEQARGMTGASAGYVATARKLTPERCEQVKRGQVTVSSLHNTRRTPTDAAIDRYIARVGADRVWKVLERCMQPALFAMEVAS